jgi:predicted HicB family RNase H-like nuclease
MTKNITLTASEDLIEAARVQAKQENTSLNNLFRDWLSAYVNKQLQQERKERVQAFLKSVQKSDVKSDRHYSRQEMNER